MPSAVGFLAAALALVLQHARGLTFDLPPEWYDAVTDEAPALHALFVGLLDETPVAKASHAELLDSKGFWILAAALILCVGFGAIQFGSSNEKQLAAAEFAADKKFAPLGMATNFVFCAVSLYATMLMWGITQEYVMTKTFGTAMLDPTRRCLEAVCIVFCNRAMTTLVTGVALRVHGKDLCFPGFGFALWPAISNTTASWCQYASLAYISWMWQTTAKSSKILPVVIISSFRGKHYSISEYAEFLLITVALWLFFSDSAESVGNSKELAEIGVFLMILSTAADSLTPHLQDMMFEDPGLAPLQATFATALFSCGILFAIIVWHGDDSWQIMQLLASDSSTILQMLVLASSSSAVQFLMSHTIKNFGPIVLTLIVTTRQVVSVCLSALLFGHHMPGLSICAVTVIFGTILARTLRSASVHLQPVAGGGQSRTQWAGFGDALLPAMRRHAHLSSWTLVLLISLLLTGVLQEFLSISSFTFGEKSEKFDFPITLLAVTRTMGIVFSLLVMWFQKLGTGDINMCLLIWPAAPRDLAAVLDYAALFVSSDFVTVQVVKLMKVIPVMLFGRILKNRSYALREYAEALAISIAVSLFVFDFTRRSSSVSAEGHTNHGLHVCLVLMTGNVLCEALHSNVEDYVFQASDMKPAQVMLGLELFSAVVFWPLAWSCGELSEAVAFCGRHRLSGMILVLLGLSSSVGCYASATIVKSYGPAFLSFLLMSRQVLSLVISMGLFHHNLPWLSGCALVSLSAFVLVAPAGGFVRRATEPRSQDG